MSTIRGCSNGRLRDNAKRDVSNNSANTPQRTLKLGDYFSTLPPNNLVRRRSLAWKEKRNSPAETACTGLMSLAIVGRIALTSPAGLAIHPRRRGSRVQSWINHGPASATLAHDWSSSGPALLSRRQTALREGAVCLKSRPRVFVMAIRMTIPGHFSWCRSTPRIVVPCFTGCLARWSLVLYYGFTPEHSHRGEGYTAGPMQKINQHIKHLVVIAEPILYNTVEYCCFCTDNSLLYIIILQYKAKKTLERRICNYIKIFQRICARQKCTCIFIC